jgi:hypothetical protein
VAATSSALLKKGAALLKSPLLSVVTVSAIKGKKPPLELYFEFFMVKQLMSFVNNKGMPESQPRQYTETGPVILGSV